MSLYAKLNLQRHAAGDFARLFKRNDVIDFYRIYQGILTSVVARRYKLCREEPVRVIDMGRAHVAGKSKVSKVPCIVQRSCGSVGEYKGRGCRTRLQR